MTRKCLLSLRPGDEVHWRDPDEGACSRNLVIQEIEVFEEGIVRITTPDGDVVEAYFREVS